MIDFRIPGRLLSLSKSVYQNLHPENIVVFDANILTRSRGKIWYGDLDVTLDMKDLQRLAKDLNEEIWIMRELDGRFSGGKSPNWENFVLRIEPNGAILYHVNMVKAGI